MLNLVVIGPKIKEQQPIGVLKDPNLNRVADVIARR